jgi:diadenylate cyclase
MLLSLRLWTGHGAESPRYTQGFKFIAARGPGTKRRPHAAKMPPADRARNGHSGVAGRMLQWTTLRLACAEVGLLYPYHGGSGELSTLILPGDPGVRRTCRRACTFEGKPMARSPEDALKATLARVAPGTALRDGLERILRGRTGALIVLGIDRTIESICSGGFEIGIDFSPTRLRELAKMDGAIVCDKDASNILRAAVQLVPDASIETQESGTRHRTAERVAIQTGVPVISVSQSMQIIALYVNGLRHVLEGSEKVLARANQALATLERYRSRLDQVTSSLSALEIEAMVTVRDVAVTLQRQEMVRRISEEISQYVLELGEDGRLLSLQLDELTVGRGPGSDVIIRDYSGPAASAEDIDNAVKALVSLGPTELIDLGKIAGIVGFAGGEANLDAVVQPRGYRLLSGLKAVPKAVADRLVDHFGGLQFLMAATIDDLMTVDGIGDQRARTVREGLSRMAEASLLDRFL